MKHMQDASELKSIINDYSIAIVCLREVLKQTERLEADHTKQYPGILEWLKERLNKAINRMDALHHTYTAALRRVEAENEKEKED